MKLQSRKSVQLSSKAGTKKLDAALILDPSVVQHERTSVICRKHFQNTRHHQKEILQAAQSTETPHHAYQILS